MSLRENWINFLYKSATSSRKVRNLLTPVKATFFFALIALFIFLSLPVDKFLRFPEIIPEPWNLIISAPITLIGLFLILWSNFHFIKAGGTPVPLNPPPRLVTTGPYAFVRNPMLAGLFILLFGLGILLNSISLSFIFTPLFALLNIWELKTIEEPELEKRLGKEYLEYKKRVPMFVPRPKIGWGNKRK